MRRLGVGGLVSAGLVLATVILVGGQVVAGFWSSDSRATAAGVVRCLDLRQPKHLDAVRRLPQPELRRYIVACNLTYTKECSAGGTVDPRTGIERYAEPPHCTIRDRHGKIVRTYTTDALRP